MGRRREPAQQAEVKYEWWSSEGMGGQQGEGELAAVRLFSPFLSLFKESYT